ncbi:sialate O-acetylesterase [Salinibacter ruber]|uniref:sialate O-acetylesterase n=1 Tax=Salinibacter ruber TaxID=146919 RepID=UPI000E5964B5
MRRAIIATGTFVIFLFGGIIGVNAFEENLLGRRLTDWITWRDLPPSFPMNTPPDSTSGKLSLFILAGQSNMVGRAPPRPEDRTPIPGAWLFGNDYRWHRAQSPLDTPFRQVDAVSEDINVGVGPGLFFAELFRSRVQGRVIGLIPCAKGGSAITAWQPSRSDTTLYGSCLKRARAASPMGRIEGILFHQGETDALPKRPSRNGSINPYRWKSLFSKMAQSWRKDLDSPHLPIVFAQIGSHRGPSSRFPNWEVVQSQQSAVSLPSVQMVKTSDLPLRDYVHLSREGSRVLGRRMLDSWINLTAEGTTER